MKNKMSQNSGKAVKVIDLIDKKTFVYSSLKKAATGMNVTQPNLSMRLKNCKGSIIIKNRFKVELINT